MNIKISFFASFLIFCVAVHAQTETLSFSLKGRLVETRTRQGLKLRIQATSPERLNGVINRNLLSQAAVHQDAYELVGLEGYFKGEILVLKHLSPIISVTEFVSDSKLESGARMVSIRGAVIAEEGKYLFFPKSPEVIELVGPGGFEIVQGEAEFFPSFAAEVHLTGFIHGSDIVLRNPTSSYTLLDNRVISRRSELVEGQYVMLVGQIYENSHGDWKYIAGPIPDLPAPLFVPPKDEEVENPYSNRRKSLWIFYPDRQQNRGVEIPETLISESLRQYALFLDVQEGSQADQNISMHVSDDGRIPTAEDPKSVRIIGKYMGSGTIEVSNISSHGHPDTCGPLFGTNK